MGALSAYRLMEIENDLLNILFLYNPINGSLIHNPSRPSSSFLSYRGYKIWKSLFSGKEAGSLNSNGYLVVTVCTPETGKRIIRAHRIAFAISTGIDLPDADHKIDHKNGIRHDNRASNLRIVSSKENNNNTARRAGSSGYKGVTLLPSGRFSAALTVNGARTYLGSFDTAIDAHKAYGSASRLAGRTQRHISG